MTEDGCANKTRDGMKTGNHISQTWLVPCDMQIAIAHWIWSLLTGCICWPLESLETSFGTVVEAQLLVCSALQKQPVQHNVLAWHDEGDWCKDICWLLLAYCWQQKRSKKPPSIIQPLVLRIIQRQSSNWTIKQQIHSEWTVQHAEQWLWLIQWIQQCISQTGTDTLAVDDCSNNTRGVMNTGNHISQARLVLCDRQVELAPCT